MNFKEDHYLEVMVSTSLKGKAPSNFDWASFYKTFRRVTVTPRGLAILIFKGYSTTPLWEQARREENFVSAGHIAFDFDTGDETAALDYLLRVGTFAWLFASFGYTTTSHTEEAPRSRLVFVLEYPIYNAEDYRAAYQAVAWKIAADGSHCDPACKDPLRLYYGSEGCTVESNWSVLGKAALDMVLLEYKAAHPPAKPPVSFRQRVAPTENMTAAKLRQIGDKVRRAPADEGHNTLLRQAKLAGGYIGSGAMSEVEATAALVDAYMSRPTSTAADLKDTERAVKDGIASGRGQPIYFEQVSSVGSLLS